MAVEDTQDEIAALVRQLHQTQQRLQELAGGQVDAVVHPGGHSYLLHEAQEKLRRSEESLQRQQAELRALFDLVPAMIWFKDTQNTFLRVNQRVAEATGLTVSEIEGRSAADLFPKEAARSYADDLEVIRSGIPKLGIVEKLPGPAGQERWVQTDKVPYCDPDGKVIGIVLMVQDITERQRASALLLESRQRLALATASARLGIWEWEVKTNKLIWDTPMYHLYGILEEDFSGAYEAWQKGVHPDDRQRTAAEIFAAVEGADGFHTEFRIVWPGGEVRDIEAHAIMQRVDDGSSPRMIGVNLDITERKRAENEVRFNEQRYRSLVEATTAIVWDTPASGEFEVLQPGWSAFTGQTFEELCGWGWLRAIHPEDQEETARVWTAAVASQSTYQVEHRLQARDATYHNMLARAVPILAEDGAIVQWVGVHTDITERKKLEQQVLRSQRMESIGTLAGGIAHDLNNVLGPIILALDIMNARFPDAESQELISIVSASAQRGADMVRQVLSFGRGVEGRRMDVQIKHLVREIVKIAEDTFLKNIQIRTILPQDVWTVSGDPTQLHQVLLNLCVNARDAMPDGGTLTISARNVTFDAHYAGLDPWAKPGSYVDLQVEDNGMGMPPSVMEKIFDPFYTTKDVGKGSGLGLSTTLGIVKSHGGFIRVYSEPGKGTKFRVYLPAQTDVSPATAAAREAEMPRGHGELVLVVDDESSVQQIIKQTLEHYGYHVLVASDGAEAVALYAQRPAEIAALLTDMMMPGIDGPATIQIVRKMNPKLPIIAASGLSTDGQVAKATNLGVKHFLPKPFTAEVLLKTLRQALAGDP